MAAGTHIYVQGHGHGIYKHFSRNTFGANDHTIAFEGRGGPPGTKVLRLRDMRWAVRNLEIKLLEGSQGGSNMRTAEFHMTRKMEEWTVPDGLAEGAAVIEACGGQGGGAEMGGSTTGGAAARVVGMVPVQPGDKLAILVGAVGGKARNTGGGGGGSFVVKAANQEPLIVAGGGGGAGWEKAAVSASLSETGARGVDAWSGSPSGGGKGGAGGHGDGYYTKLGHHSGGSGGGLREDGLALRPGIDRDTERNVGKSFANGGAGGLRGEHNMPERGGVGGFGGGGCGNRQSGGGGGGYSGGGGGGGANRTGGGGGGGGSFNADKAQGFAEFNKGGGNGRVVITYWTW